MRVTKWLVTALLIWLVARTVDPARIWDAVQQANPYLLGFGVTLTVVVNLIKAARWQLLLRAIAPAVRFGTP